ncbi:MAG: TonB-dependent receptor, partial [Robiginitomaculum sp.]|nr:TonB-dependent receptor [Robiginitomaculum sp.]
NFDTKTTGIDIVGRMPLDLGAGNTSVALAMNYNNTTVTNSGRILPLTANRRNELEKRLPKWKGNIMFTHEQGMWRGLARVNYHSSWLDVNSPPSRPNQQMSSEITIDLEAGAQVTENVEVIIGAANVLDNFPDENLTATRIGQLYASQAPFGFNGGSYYAKLRITY